MAKTVIIISALVDSTIRDGQPDTNFVLKRTLEELDSHIESTPLRADYLYFTRETIPRTNTTLNYLTRMLENPFLRVDKVCYITEKDSPEITSVRYIVEEKHLSNWEIVECPLTRENVTGIVTGSARTDNYTAKHKSVYRVPRAAYVQDRMKSKESLEEDYIDDEQILKDVPSVEVPEPTISEAEDVASIIHVAGLPSEERTALAFLLAQYLSLEGKTLILEKDVDYHLLTEFITKSEVPCRKITVTELLSDINKGLEQIRTCSEKLICVTAFERIEYSYAFLCNVLYNNLSNKISYFVREDEFGEVPLTVPFIVCMPASVIGLLRTAECLDTSYAHLMRFVGVNLQSLSETKLTNGNTMATILSDVMEINVRDVPIINISSLRIGGDSGYDLRSIIGI